MSRLSPLAAPPNAPPPRLLVVAVGAVGALLTLASCGGDEGGGAVKEVETLCTDGAQKCYGNALLTCEADGKAWKVANCGEAKSCGDGQGGLGCQPVSCVPGARSCDDKKVLECPADGQSDPTQVAFCKPTEHCTMGACVTSACKDGDKRCGYKAVLSCTGGAWTSQKCGADERCDDASVACVARACEPSEISCATANRRRTCNQEGSGWVEVACAAGEVCSDGVCHAKVKGVDDAADAGGAADVDAGGGDTDAGGFLDVPKDEFVFEPLDKLTLFKADKAPIPAGAQPFEYEFAAASFLSVEQLLQITGNANLEKLEIACAPLEEYTTGATNDIELQWPNSSVKMNDGTNDPAIAQFRYEAIEYTITINEFADVGGRVKGNVQATMADVMVKGKTFYIEASFDIKRTQ